MPTTARSVLRQTLLEILGEYRSLTTSSIGNAGGTTFVDTGLAEYGEAADSFPGWWALQTSGANDTEERRILGASGYDGTSTATVALPYTNRVQSGVTYLLSKFRFADLHAALNAGIRSAQAGGRLYLPLRDQSLVVNNVLVDSGFEKALSGGSFPDWGDSGAGSALTAETNRVKHGTQSAKLVAGGGAVAQLAQSSTSLTPAADTRIEINELVGKTVRSKFWVWAAADATARIQLDFGGGDVVSSSYHTAADQWELLDVSTTVPTAANKVTTICEVAASGTGYFDAGWTSVGRIYRMTVPTAFIDGPYRVEQQSRELVTDGSFVPLASAPTEGRILQLRGKGRLTEPTTDTGTTEVDDTRADLIIAHAGRWLNRMRGHQYGDIEALRAIDWDESIREMQDQPRVKMGGMPAERSSIYHIEEDASGRYIMLDV